MYFLVNFSDIWQSIISALRSLALTIFEILLQGIVLIYNLFNQIAQHRLFGSNPEIIRTIYTRIGLILGLFMVFRLTFSAIQYLINPDNLLDSQKGIGNIIKKVLIVIILLGSVHFLFNTAYDFQSLLLDSDNNIVAKIIIGDSGNTDDGGVGIANELFLAFYRAKSDAGLACSDNEIKAMASTLTSNGGKLPDDAYECVANKNTAAGWEIDFDWFWGTIAAIFVLYVIAIYTIQVGVRCIQLAYLELIAPVPIMMYLNPKGDETLKKWGQQCLTTYLDVFIRIGIMYLIILIFKQLQVEDLFSGGGLSVGIIILIALMIFAKKVPELIKEIFPSMGGAAGLGLGFGMPKEAKGLATFGLGAGIGAVAGAATGFKYGAGTKGGRIGGTLTGLARGGLGGAKTKGNIFKNVSGGMANQRSAMQRAYDRNNDDSTFWGRTFGAGDAARTKAAFDEELALYDAYDQNTKIIDAELEKNSMVQSAMAKKQALMERYQRGGATPTAAEIKQADDLIKQAKKTALQVEIGRGPTGKLKAALDNAEAIREKGARSGYSGFGTTSISTGTAADRAQAYNDNKDSIQDGIRSIKDPSGSRNKAYKEAEANAKYAKNK